MRLVNAVLRVRLEGAQDGASGEPTPVTLPSNPEGLAALKSNLRRELLQGMELEGRVRQYSNPWPLPTNEKAAGSS